jgi:hypothetical protein
MSAGAANAENYYYAPTPFQQGYDSVANAYNNGLRNSMMIQQQRANEAMINLERRRQGLPPCSFGLIGQWQGRPAC